MQSTVPGSRAEATSSQSNIAPNSASTTANNQSATESRPVQVSSESSDATKASSKKASDEQGAKMQFSDLQNILGNLGKLKLINKYALIRPRGNYFLLFTFLLKK